MPQRRQTGRHAHLPARRHETQANALSPARAAQLPADGLDAHIIRSVSMRALTTCTPIDRTRSMSKIKQFLGLEVEDQIMGPPTCVSPPACVSTSRAKRGRGDAPSIRVVKVQPPLSTNASFPTQAQINFIFDPINKRCAMTHPHPQGICSTHVATCALWHLCQV